MNADQPVLAELPDCGRYVVLEHRTAGGSGRPDHWDVMLETSAALLTWESPPFLAAPSVWGVLPLAPHRLVYLDYEGPISENRGCVRRLDRGQFRVLARQAGRVSLEWVGPVFGGRWDWILADGNWSIARLS